MFEKSWTPVQDLPIPAVERNGVVHAVDRATKARSDTASPVCVVSRCGELIEFVDLRLALYRVQQLYPDRVITCIACLGCVDA